jgi:hypothetical protein
MKSRFIYLRLAEKPRIPAPNSFKRYSRAGDSCFVEQREIIQQSAQKVSAIQLTALLQQWMPISYPTTYKAPSKSIVLNVTNLFPCNTTKQFNNRYK